MATLAKTKSQQTIQSVKGHHSSCTTGHWFVHDVVCGQSRRTKLHPFSTVLSMTTRNYGCRRLVEGDYFRSGRNAPTCYTWPMHRKWHATHSLCMILEWRVCWFLEWCTELRTVLCDTSLKQCSDQNCAIHCTPQKITIISQRRTTDVRLPNSYKMNVRGRIGLVRFSICKIVARWYTHLAKILQKNKASNHSIATHRHVISCVESHFTKFFQHEWQARSLTRRTMTESVHHYVSSNYTSACYHHRVISDRVSETLSCGHHVTSVWTSWAIRLALHYALQTRAGMHAL